MIYYYFATKAKLYVAVLEAAYRRNRIAEGKVDLDHPDPRQCLKNLVAFTYDYHFENPSYVKLIMGENLNDGRYLLQSAVITEMYLPVTQRIDRVLRRGYQSGLFHEIVTPLEVHTTISALAFFNVSNRGTFSTIFEADMTSVRAQRERKTQILATILGRLNANLDDFSCAYD